MKPLPPPKPHCPKCLGEMLYVTSVPHPASPDMRKITFACLPCNRTWAYVLAAELAAQYETEPVAWTA